MATYNELFPYGDPRLSEIDPNKPRALGTQSFGSSLGAATRRALPTDGGAGFDLNQFEADLDALMGTPVAPKATGETKWGDSIKNIGAALAETGAMATGALEYGSRQLLGDENNSFVTDRLAAGRRGLSGVAEDITASMSPEAQERLARQWLTLDPEQRIWQGGPGEFLSAVGYKLGRALPSTLVTLLPAARLFKAGMTPGAITYLGASEGALSMGGIANGVAQEIEGMTEEELQTESPRYQQMLREGLPAGEARQRLIQEAQGAAPLIGGATVGAISAVAGRYLEPVFVREGGMSLSRRALTGFAAEAPQEAAQSAAEQAAQNIAAQIYDTDRSPYEGVGEATVEGGVIGGLMGGGFSAALGQRQRREPAPPVPQTTPTEQFVDPAVAAAIKNSDLQSLQEADLAAQPTMSYGQGEMFGPPPGQPDILAPDPPRDVAMARVGGGNNPALVDAVAYANRRGGEMDRGLIQRDFTTEEPMAFGGTDPAGFALRQNQFQYTYGEPPTPPSTALVPAEPIQQSLGLRGPRERGMGAPIITPTPGVAAQDPMADQSVPPEFSNERLPVNTDPAGRRPTRADVIRAAQQRTREGSDIANPLLMPAYGGTVRDENQIDMFDAPADGGPGEPPAGPSVPSGRQLLGFTVTGRAPDGTVRFTQDVASREEGQALVDEYSLNEQGELTSDDTLWTVEPVSVLAGRERQAPDQPTAEPLQDILTQSIDLADPDSPRLGLYLSRDNVASLRQRGVLERVRRNGVPLMNFDLRGGTLIAKNRKVADELLAMRKQGVPMQEILGLATGAGSGKPADGRVVVQQRDPATGSVTRESLVRDEAEADALAAQWDREDPARETVILDPRAALSRRARIVAAEDEALGEERDVGRTTKRVSKALERVGDPQVAEQAKKVATANFTEGNQRVAAQRLTDAALQAEAERRMRAGSSGIPAPRDIRLASRADVSDTVVEAPEEELQSWRERRKALRGVKKQAERLSARAAKLEKAARRASESTRDAATATAKAARDEARKARASYEAQRITQRREQGEWAKSRTRKRTKEEIAAARTQRSEDANERYATLHEKRSTLLDERRNQQDELDAAFEEEGELLKTPQTSTLRNERGQNTPAYQKRLDAVRERKAAAEKAISDIDSDIDDVEQGLRALLQSYTIETVAGDLSRAAIEVDSTEARRATRYNDRVTRVETPEIGTLTPMTPEEVDNLKGGRLEQEFLKAANFLSGLRPARARDFERRADALQEADVSIDPSIADMSQGMASGRTVDQYVADYTTPSEKLKIIRRAQALLSQRESGVMGRSPKAVKSERRGAKGGTLDLSPLFREDVSAKEREVSAEQRKANVEKANASMRALSKATQAAERLMVRMHSIVTDNYDAAYGRAYLRSMHKLAIALLRSGNRTLAAAKMADEISDLLTSLSSAPEDKLAARLAALGRAQTRENVRLAVRSDPRILSDAPAIKLDRNELLKAFDAWVDGKSDALGNLLRQMTVDQMNYLRGVKWRTGPQQEASVKALDDLQNAYRQWMDAAQEVYRRDIQPIMMLARRGGTVSDVAVATVARGLDKLRTNVWADFGDRRFARGSMRLQEAAEPVMDMIEAPLLRRLEGLGFDIDEDGNVIGWTRPEIKEQRAAEAELPQRVEEPPPAPPAPTREEVRARQMEQYDTAVNKLMDVLDRAVVNADISLAEQKFYDSLRKIGVWQRDGIGDLLSSDARSYNRRVGPRLARKEITARQAKQELRDTFLDLGKPKADTKLVIDSVTPTTASLLPYRPDITEAEFRRLPEARREAIRAARVAEAKRRANMTPEARRAAERLDVQEYLNVSPTEFRNLSKEMQAKVRAARIAEFRRTSALPSESETDVRPELLPHRPDLTAAQFRVLPQEERARIRTARLALIKQARKDLTASQFRALPAEERATIRQARMLLDNPRANVQNVEALTSFDPTRPDVTSEQFRALPKEERDRIRAARLDARKRGLKVRVVSPIVASELDGTHSEAMERLASYVGGFEESTLPKLGQVLRILDTHLPADSPYRNTVKALLRLPNMNTLEVIPSWDFADNADGGQLFAPNEPGGRPFIALNMNAPFMRYPNEFIHVVLHEAVHAASTTELLNNASLRGAWQQLRRMTYNRINSKFVANRDALMYGDEDVFEFVAEVFSNKSLQDEMKAARVQSINGTLWERVVELVRRLLGMSPEYDNLLDIAISLRDQTFSGREFTARENAKYQNLSEGRKLAYRRYTGVDVADDLIDRFRSTAAWRGRTYDFAVQSKEATHSGVLSAMTVSQIEDSFKKLFETETGNPLSNWYRAFAARNADNSANMEEVDRRSRVWSTLKEKDRDNEANTSRIMTQATVHGVHPDVPLSHANNEHIKTDGKRAKHAELSRAYAALPQEWKDHYQAVKKYYAETHEKQQALAVLNALRAYLTIGKNAPMKLAEFEAKYNEDNVLKKGLNTKKGLEKEFASLIEEGALTQNAVASMARLGALRTMSDGPYFPVQRFGKYAVYAEKLRETKTFGTTKELNAYREALLSDDPTLQFKRGSDNLSLEVWEVEFRMAETPSEAQRAYDEMVALYGKFDPATEQGARPVNIKRDAFTDGAAIAGTRGLRSILDRLEGNAAAQAAIKNFYLASLADTSFRKREARRKNTRGFPETEQHRTFASYSKAAAYYMSQLRYGWKMADARADIKNLAEQRGVRAGQVAREIKLRDDMSIDPEEMSPGVMKANEITQFMLLTSVSYWAINLTQPWMVTLPYLGAKYGQANAAKALSRAQSLIFKPIKDEAKASWLGLKALGSKAAAENAFSVLDDVKDTIRRNGGARSNDYLDMLTKLQRQSIIDLSLVAELRQIADGSNVNTKWQRTLDASRIMSHLTEVNNRILTAVAAYDLALDRGLTHEQAIKEAEGAVERTQFNYSGANAPRLFQQGGPLGKAGPLLFQFMKYPQHMYALMIRQVFRALRNPTERREALKILGGISATHLAVGGILGWTLQPFKWALGMIIAGLDDEDDRAQDVISGAKYDRSVREFAYNALGDDLGRAVSKGPVGAMLGVDLSTRMSLGTLYFLDLNAENTESLLGSLVASFGGPALNIGMTALNAPKYLAEGDVSKAVEAITPKFVKDVFKAARMADEGITGRDGTVYVSPDKITFGDTVRQGLGFGTMRASESFAKGEAIRVREDVQKAKRAKLMRRFVNADSDAERAEALEAIREFSKSATNPVTRSDILKYMRRRYDRNARIAEFGADLRGRNVLLAEEGDPYEYDE